MAYNTNTNRFSTYSQLSSVSRPGGAVPQPSAQLSTQTLLNALHTAYTSGAPHALEHSTSLVVNTWVTATLPSSDGRQGAVVDPELAKRAWEHARRRLEDGCILLGSLHDSTPSVLDSFVASLPISLPATFYSALTALRPFLTCSTPQNPSQARHSGLAVTFSLGVTGNLVAAHVKLSTNGINTQDGLVEISSQPGNRAFDVFYYLLSSASSTAERDALNLQHPSKYKLLRKSETYDPPSYMPTADDTAAADEWRAALKVIGITGRSRRDLLSVLAALLKLGETTGYLLDDAIFEQSVEDAASLLGLDPQILAETCNTSEREILIGAIYEAVFDWVVLQANQAIAAEMANQRAHAASEGDILTPDGSDDEDTVSVTVLDIPTPQLGKALALRNVFDDSEGINAEIKADGVTVNPAGHSVLTEMEAAVLDSAADLNIVGEHSTRERELQRDRREAALEKIGHDTEEDSFLQKILFPVRGSGIMLGQHNRFDASTLLSTSRVWFHLSLHPTDELPSAISANHPAWSAGSPSRQLRAWRLPEWANRRNKHLDFTADFDVDEFCNRYARLGCQPGKDGIESFILERGWSNGEVVIGNDRVWLREAAWWQAETMLEMIQDQRTPSPDPAFQVQHPDAGSAYFGPFGDNAAFNDSQPSLLQRNQSSATLARSIAPARSLAPTAAMTMRSVSGGDYGLGNRGDEKQGALASYNELDPELPNAKKFEAAPISTSRNIWVATVWSLTFWIPSFLLRYIGQMKRPDVRMAWREKLVLVFFILLLNATIVFYIIEFGRLLCPNYDKAWNDKEVGYHQGDNDFYVSVYGRVYDITHFWRQQHSSIAGAPVTTALMEPTAGQNLNQMFPIPLYVACSDLVNDPSVSLRYNTTNPAVTFTHYSGSTSPFQDSALSSPDWYADNFLTTMKQYYKGDLVYKRSDVASDGENNQHMWFIIHGQVYDLTDYFYTVTDSLAASKYLDSTLTNMVQNNPGQDITDEFERWRTTNSTAAQDNYVCLNNAFYIGKTDFRQTARCQVNNYILLVFTIILCSVILIKFLSALQFGSKRRPSAQDKFVICQVPAYTEGEEHLRKGLDSLTATSYDNKRKLICVICDGMIVGGGNDRPTPKIVLDILGVDPKIDPPALPFKSVGQSNEQLNYGKVYSGLYEYEGNVVPYLVVVKVGKESEQTKAKPGNRGKRDSQILLMSFLNRVHHRSPMSPLELEMFHQINNVIGVDPELYEYLFMVDADTMVKEDALNRLVAACANDSKIAGICGETSLENEERSWWTMIQVYEYYISHHLAKAFESLFGSVTCLPGCFCMYRLRTADKGKPLIISDKVINEYSDCNVDTLHKKNLLSLGEDRYLTTLMTKHFPSMRYKFVPDAYAQTAAPDTWSILVSQRRRWINSTIHNLAELMFVKDMCGFCCFSMRFVVFIDLFGTIILPATFTYLVYLIVRVALHQGQFPLISIIIIAAVYGLQAIIFIVKRQWQHIGWMIIYILAFPIYSLILPVYSFWKQDDFSWGSTRIVVGENGKRAEVIVTDDGFDPRSIPLQSWDDYALMNNLPGRRGPMMSNEKYDDASAYEMDEMRSVYSASVKPASTILTGFNNPNRGGANASSLYMPPPQSPAPFQQRPSMANRNSHYSNYTDYASPGLQEQQTPFMQQDNGSHYSIGPHMPSASRAQSPFGIPNMRSSDNLSQMAIGGASASAPINRAGRRPSSSNLLSRPTSTVNFQGNPTGHGEATDGMIVEAVQACLGTVDLDSVSKKGLKAMVEQRLQMQLTPERRAFLDRQIDFELANM